MNSNFPLGTEFVYPPAGPVVRIKRVHEDALMPEFGTAESAGFDLSLPETVVIPPQGVVMAGTGLVIRAPRRHMLMIVPRSSTFKNWRVKLANTIGIVDEDYSGDADEVRLLLHNPGYITSQIPAHTRLAQGIFVPVYTDFTWVEEKTMGDSRGGFGSTGEGS